MKLDARLLDIVAFMKDLIVDDNVGPFTWRASTAASCKFNRCLYYEKKMIYLSRGDLPNSQSVPQARQYF